MATDPSSSSAAAAAALPSYEKAVDAYRKAVSTAATATAYVVLARGMARELLPHDLRAAASWAASLLRARFEPSPAERRTLVIKRALGSSHSHHDGDCGLFDEVRQYLATRIDPHSMRRLCLSGGVCGARKVLSMEHGDSMTDVFEGVQFTWASIAGDGRHGALSESLELSFDAEHTDMALGRYVPFITASVEEAQRQDRALRIYMNEGSGWRGMSHHHPATFDTLAMDPELKQSVLADLDRFLKRREYYRRIGKAWKRGYLLYGPPGTGKSSLVAAMANYLRFNLYDLDLSKVDSNSTLQWLLTSMPDKSLLVIEDIDCCFDAAASRKDVKAPKPVSYTHLDVYKRQVKDRLDPALLRPGRMDMHVYMGYCGWEAFKTLARNYFLLDDHQLFPEIQALLAEVEVTPAAVSEMLLRSEDADAALQGLAKFLGEKKQAIGESN
uniref:AAA-ATPase n=1 Tax=Dichanthelium oligosanthes TaxID=888268 RepID=A0A1E5WGS7_9POAL